MKKIIAKYYENIVLNHPRLTILGLFLFVAGFAPYIEDFKLDASADAIILENDKDLKYFRAMNRQYKVDEFVILTWTPNGSIFTAVSLAELKSLSESLRKVDGIHQVRSILDLPLLNSPRIKLSQLSQAPRTLTMPDTDLRLAEKEFLESPLYKDLVLSADSKTTLLLIYLTADEKYNTLLAQRERLRAQFEEKQPLPQEIIKLEKISQEFRDYSPIHARKQQEIIADIRQVVDRYRSGSTMYLGGVPMIVADMISMIKHDLIIFGTIVIGFLILVLLIIFRRIRWVLLPITCCSLTVLIMLGLLGFLDWRVTVVSSNFVALLLIIAMSMTIHLCVRLREMMILYPDTPVRKLLKQTMHFMFKPCVYTSLTTIVAFVSLIVSGIRPVIDFGYIMTIGIIFAFFIIFLLFPSFLVLLKRDQHSLSNPYTSQITTYFAHLVQKKYRIISLIGLIFALVSIGGISKLEVENRFIDYFHDDTEIHHGMLEIDRKLGGTTPLDVTIRMPMSQHLNQDVQSDEEDLDEYLDDTEDSSSYWLSTSKAEEIKKIHDFFSAQPEIGKVMSLTVLIRLAEMLNGDKKLSDVDIAFLGRFLSDDIKGILYKPYITEDGNEIRFNMRVIDSDKNLQRAQLINKVTEGLRDFGYKDEDFRVNGMLVLYNNMLQSLYKSQILTISIVFLAIMSMFIILFRSLRLALIAILPNALSAALVLGFMGWYRIPLDMMTITIAAISIGIAVDNTIHYIVRFKREFPVDYNYPNTVLRCHKSIGKAMYYTSITIVIGFSILSISNFLPTIYFGLLTSLAMFVALIASLTLLPSLLILFKPIKIPR